MGGERAILSLRGVTQSFGGLKAIDGLSFDVQRGAVCGIIGPNGAGKTTVFNVVTGVYSPQEGDVLWKGERINGLPAHRIVDRGIARTFQNIRLFNGMSVLDNVRVAFFGKSRAGLAGSLVRSQAFQEDERRTREKAMELLAAFGLEGKADQVAGSLPYGEQRRLEIARALGNEPEMLILDEPAAGMNFGEIDELNLTILKLRDRYGLTVLLVEHQMRLVMGICERIIVMNFGKLIADGPPDRIKSDEKVLEAYLGKDDEP